VNKRTKETYLDGALFHNNPVRVAHQESKLIWEDVRDAHPDILLSIGTSHNGQETMGYVEPTLRRRKHMTTLRGTASEPVVPPRPSRAPWLRLPVFPSFLGVMVNRMENILNTEQTWKNFRTDLSRTPSADERYERINPNIGQHPPRLDEKDKLDELRTKVIDRLVQSANYQRKIARISRRLIASCFYFEKQQHVLHDSHYLCPGKPPNCYFLNLNEKSNFIQARFDVDSLMVQPSFGYSESTFFDSSKLASNHISKYRPTTKPINKYQCLPM